MAKKRDPSLMTLQETATRLRCSVKRIHRFVDMQELHPQATDESGAPMFNRVEVNELAIQENAPEAAGIISQLTEALTASQSHIDNLIGLVVKPIGETTDTLIQALKESREEAKELQKERREVLDMYVNLLRETALFKWEIEKAQADQKMKEDAFELAKAQVPIIVNNLTAGSKLVNSFSSKQLKALLFAGGDDLLSKEQQLLIQKLILQAEAVEKAQAEAKEAAEKAKAESVNGTPQPQPQGESEKAQ